MKSLIKLLGLLRNSSRHCEEPRLLIDDEAIPKTEIALLPEVKRGQLAMTSSVGARFIAPATRIETMKSIITLLGLMRYSSRHSDCVTIVKRVSLRATAVAKQSLFMGLLRRFAPRNDKLTPLLWHTTLSDCEEPWSASGDEAIPHLKTRLLRNSNRYAKQGFLAMTTLAGLAFFSLNAHAAVKIGSLDKGLVGHWDLSQESLKSTTVLADKIPNQNNGASANTPSFTTDQHGQSNKAMSFNGTSDLIISSTSLFNRVNGDPMTVSAWIKLTIMNEWRNVVGNRASGQNYTWIFAISPSGQVTLFTANGPNTAYGTVSLNAWQHISATQDSSGVQTIYINGVLQGTSSGNGYRNATPNVLAIGGYTNGEYFPGSIFDVRVYNRALSATEAAQLYNEYR